MSQVAKSILRGFILPHERLEWWDAESGEYDAGGAKLHGLPSGGAVPGIPSPSSTVAPGMALQATGTQSIRGAVDILTQRGGFPDRDRASFLWRNNGETPYVGWDAPNVLTGWEPINWTSSAAASSLYPHAVTLDNGTVVAVVQTAAAGSSTTVTAWVRSPTAGTWASNSIHMNSLQTQDAHPCLCVLPSGRVLCFFWLNDEDQDLANVAMYYSDDSGASWSLGQDACLADSILTSTATGAGSLNYSTGRLRCAYSNGQILLLANLLSMDTAGATHLKRDCLYHYASLDLGASFSLVTATESDGTTTAGANYQDIVVLDGRFVVAYLDIQTFTPSIRLLTNTFDPWTNATVIDGAPGGEPLGGLDGTSKYYNDADLCLWRDESGILYLTGRQVTITNEWVVYHSQDSGSTWAPMAKSSSASGAGKWWDTNDNSTHPQDACVTWQRGRALVIHSHVSNPGIYDESLSCSYLGGYSSVTMPTYEPRRAQAKQVTWGQTYAPYDLPADCGWTHEADVGAPTESIATGALVLVAGAAEAIHYNRSPAGSISTGIVAMALVTVGGGTATYEVRTGSVTEGYDIELRIAPTTIEVWDLVAGTQVGVTATYAAGKVQVLVGIQNNDLKVYHRVVSASDDRRTWVSTASTSGLTDDAGGTFTTFLVRYGMAAALGTRTHTWHSHCYVTDEGTAVNYVGDNIVGQSNPQDVLGRPYSSVGTYVSDGTSIVAKSGPTVHGDTWDLDVRYQFPPANLTPQLAPSLRQVWRSAPITSLDASTTKVNLAWRIDTNGAGSNLGEDCAVGNNVWGLYLDGLNCASVEVDVYYGGAWNTVTTTGVHQFAGVRKGNTVYPTTTSTFGNKYRIDEAKGASIAFYSAAYTVKDWAGVIASNTEGTTATNGVTSKTPTFSLDSLTAGLSGTPSVGIWPTRHLIVIHASGFGSNIQGIRLRIPVSAGTAYPGNPASGYFEIGKMAFGPMLVFGHDYSWQRSISLTPDVELSQARDGRRTSRVLAPARRALEIGWAEGVDVTDWRSQTGPDYLKGSANAAAVPVAFVADLPIKMMDLVRSIDGANKVLVYVPNAAYDSNSGAGGDTESTSTNWAGGAIYGRITSPVKLDQVIGDDEVNEVYKVATVTISEET